MITKAQYISGPGWRACFNDALKTIPELYHSAVTSEAQIEWNIRGGRPSGIFYDTLNRVIDDLNAGRTPKFPNIEWNREQIAKEKLRRGF